MAGRTPKDVSPEGERRTPRSARGEANRRPPLPFVSVAVRIRPNLSQEPVALWAKSSASSQRVCCHRGFLLEEYEFSRVFGPEDDNQTLFDQLQGSTLTGSVFQGVNETLFAYGQTGSGKTHTIFGSRTEPGLLELFVRRFFAVAPPNAALFAGCYEVLGDSLTDLVDSRRFLSEGSLHHEDIVHDELFVKTQRCSYQIVRVRTAEMCLSLLNNARCNRTSGISSFNDDSSRSHAIVHLFVQNPSCDGASASIGTLTLVDLAGTEKEHENPSEKGRKSARLLNTSLSSLNRLLRKLQTGSLGESERRQSVLNKCLWEYLRPGCGIALVFCASPLLQHRTATLSTLAMATDSKLIHSQRKSQYINMPSRAQAPSPSPARATAPPAPVPSGGEGPRGPSAPPTPRGETPRRPVGMARLAGQESSRRERSSSLDGASDELLVENEKLRRKLDIARTRSRERLLQVERQRDQLASDHMALQRECESLRALFIRQQQQQLAFWTGPFMEVLRRDGPPGKVEAWDDAASQATEAPPSPPARCGAAGVQGAAPCLVTSSAPRPCAAQSPSSLQSQLEYWREMALDLQRKLQKPCISSKATPTPETAVSLASRRSESSSEGDCPAGNLAEDSETTVADGRELVSH
ncbi:klpA [Symbiodinium natans]|uniref:KlpA protein n=1 Tax=Symbiodinium natans TaxID=878477 RepID=A0A812R996_9DINO|nr:klpA [Symbiodinium natans]